MNKNGVAALEDAPQMSASATGTYEMAMALRALAVPALARMYDASETQFVFTLRRSSDGAVHPEGLSPRYTAITMLGLAVDSESVTAQVLHGQDPEQPLRRLIRDLPQMTNRGDVALTMWALHAWGQRQGVDAALKRMTELDPITSPIPLVELAWTLSALALTGAAPDFCGRVRARLVATFNRRAGVFPHVVGASGLRAHVSCFADQVYPIQALSFLAQSTTDREALDVAAACAQRICEAQGAAGQWWWHYDSRTGAVLEGYPVYAVHQDSMAPMALLALTAAGGPSFDRSIERGFRWLESSPELNGGSLIDREGSGLIWRKVARREPGRATRWLQASASALHSRMRVPGLDAVFPPVAIDYEDRPYHLGWLLLTCANLKGR